MDAKGVKYDVEKLKLRKQIHIFDHKIEKKDLRKGFNELPNHKIAFVVFSTIATRDETLQIYKRENKCCRKWQNQPDYCQLDGKYPLHICAPDEPSNILWENLEMKLGEKILRKAFVYLMIFLVLLASCAIIFALKSVEITYPTTDECNEFGVDGNQSLTFAKANFDDDDDQTICWCMQQSWDDLQNDSDINDFCEDYIDATALSIGISFLTACGIIILNFSIKIILMLLTTFERTKDITKQKMKVMARAFIAMFINTSILTLLVNTDGSEHFFVINGLLFDGDYGDFTREWYIDVGKTFTLTMFLNIFNPHFVNLLFWYPLAACKRRYCLNKHKTQYELNKVYEGPEFMLELHTAQILVVIFTCFMYSGGIPVLNIFCFFTIVFLYWIDKFLVLNHYKKPPKYSQRFNDRVLLLLPFAVLFHCGISQYMYGTQHIFPTGYHEAEDENFGETYVTADVEEPYDRIHRQSSGVPNMILMIAAGGMIIFNQLISVILMQCRSKWRKNFGKSSDLEKEEESANKKHTIEEELENIRDKGLSSYHIIKNENYLPLIVAMNQSARQKRKSVISAVSLKTEILAPHLPHVKHSQSAPNPNPSIELEDRSKEQENSPLNSSGEEKEQRVTQV